MDREKVVKGLECCKNKTMLWQHDQCPYHGFDEDCESNLHADALALLKEQEAVEPVEIKLKEYGGFNCGNCGAILLSYSYPGFITDKYLSFHKFCKRCGRPVLWKVGKVDG